MATTSTASNGYSAKDHLITISTKQGPRQYLPANWRLYELAQKYAAANFSSEILISDLDRDFCVVKVKLYLGPDYDLSERKVESLKQGKLSELDKVETGAMARAARNFGISTEYALDFPEEPEQVLMETPEQRSRIDAYCKYLGLESYDEMTQDDASQVLHELVEQYDAKRQEAGKQEAEKPTARYVDREVMPLNGTRPVQRNGAGVPMR